jgi:hypothetical protein
MATIPAMPAVPTTRRALRAGWGRRLRALEVLRCAEVMHAIVRAPGKSALRTPWGRR